MPQQVISLQLFNNHSITYKAEAVTICNPVKSLPKGGWLDACRQPQS
jgi:hypothetical protein